MKKPANSSPEEVALALCELARQKDWNGLKKRLMKSRAILPDHPAVLEAFMRALPKDVAIFDRFLALGVDVDVNLQEGTALSRMARLGYPTRVEHILECGATVDVRADFGATALLVACGEGASSLYADEPDTRERFLTTIQVLLNAGADPNIANNNGYTALDVVADARWPEALNLLLQHGARLEHSYDNGRFAMARTIRRGDTVSMQMLLEYGADPKMVLEKKKDAWALAKSYGRQDMVEILDAAENARGGPGKSEQSPGQKRGDRTKSTRRGHMPRPEPSDKKALAAMKRFLGRYKVDLETTVDLVADLHGAESSMATVNRKRLRKQFQEMTEEDREIYLTISREAVTLSGHGEEEEYPIRGVELSDEGLLLRMQLGGNPAARVGLREIRSGVIQLTATGDDLGHYAWRRCKAGKAGT